MRRIPQSTRAGSFRTARFGSGPNISISMAREMGEIEKCYEPNSSDIVTLG